MDYVHPVLRFRCRINYLTKAGARGSAVYLIASIAADLALRDAEAILKEDRRRRVGQIIYKEAVEC